MERRFNSTTVDLAARILSLIKRKIGNTKCRNNLCTITLVNEMQWNYTETLTLYYYFLKFIILYYILSTSYFTL